MQKALIIFQSLFEIIKIPDLDSHPNPAASNDFPWHFEYRDKT